MNQAFDKVRSMTWHGDHLRLLDQRLLPGRVEHVVCRSAAEVADAIRAMVVRGAPA
ncbi:S-methyl-5-thioribose-1-phosphate isomerase, partial [Ectothiorhodospiraceae bacterium WFHF3C12]|nr:S-methyl-5-thioribose-1-phosphate isomerase [Ectothiorhodospiraceae bacterium WFHF3C12]